MHKGISSLAISFLAYSFEVRSLAHVYIHTSHLTCFSLVVDVVEFLGSLAIVDIENLPDPWFANMLSRLLDCAFPWLITSFKSQRF